MTAKFNVGDRVKCIDQGPNSYIRQGSEYIVEEVGSSGNVKVNNGEYFHYDDYRFELVKAAKPVVTFNAGDKVRCINGRNYGYLTEGDEYVVERATDKHLKLIGIPYDEYPHRDFELVTASEPVKKLKLPLVINRLVSKNVTVIAGTEPGKVTLVYALTGEVRENDMTEEDAIRRIEDGLWTVVGSPAPSEILTQAVTDAEAKVVAAQEGLDAAQKGLSAARQARDNFKPYLV